MSTRSQIKITSKKCGDELWFYRHSDGYPSGNLPQLRKFLEWVKEGKIRNDVEQSAGWLVIIGMQEYAYHLLPDTPENENLSWEEREEKASKIPVGDVQPSKTMSAWKVGAYEPCACRELHGGVEWFYEIDLDEKKIIIYDVDMDFSINKSVPGKSMVDDPLLTPDEMEKKIKEYTNLVNEIDGER